jgi:ribbon-helix-helix CopG family protein
MKRLQIYVEEELDDALAARAVRERTSKAALIRRFVAERLGRGTSTRDPLDAIMGRHDEEPGVIDDLVYGR